MEKVRFAIFGANQGARLGRAALHNPACNIVALAGMGELAENVAKEFDVPLYGDYKDLLKEVEMDASVIALPNNLHLESVKACAEAGIKNLLVEKPLASTPEDGQAIIDICKENDITLLVGHHRRSANLFLFLKEFINSGRLGKIVGLHSVYALNKNLDYWDEDWHKVPSGGPLLVNAIHDIDDLNNVLDKPPAKVLAIKTNSIRGNEAEDAVSAIIEFEGGPTATYFVSDGTPSPWSYDLQAQADERFAWETGENSMQIYGSKGSFGFPNMDFFTYEDREHWGWFYPLKKEHFDVELNNPLESELDHFFDLCLGRETVPRCTGEQGLQSLKIINAVIESANTGKVVTFDNGLRLDSSFHGC